MFLSEGGTLVEAAPGIASACVHSLRLAPVALEGALLDHSLDVPRLLDLIRDLAQKADGVTRTRAPPDVDGERVSHIDATVVVAHVELRGLRFAEAVDHADWVVHAASSPCLSRIAAAGRNVVL